MNINLYEDLDDNLVIVDMIGGRILREVNIKHCDDKMYFRGYRAAMKMLKESLLKSTFEDYVHISNKINNLLYNELKGILEWQDRSIKQ